jgi:hypothetical protein
MYPDTVFTIKRNKGDYEEFPLASDPQFKKALKKFREFHGKDPDEIVAVDIPQMGESEEPQFFVVLGEAVSESYLTANAVPGSSKGEAIYVHPYESPEGELPLKAVSADGKLIITVPGKHIVRDWIYY